MTGESPIGDRARWETLAGLLEWAAGQLHPAESDLREPAIELAMVAELRAGLRRRPGRRG